MQAGKDKDKCVEYVDPSSGHFKAYGQRVQNIFSVAQMNRTDFTSAFASEFARSLTKVDNTELQADAPGHGPSARNIKEQDVKRKPIYGCFDSCTQTATLHVFVCQRTSSQATS